MIARTLAALAALMMPGLLPHHALAQARLNFAVEANQPDGQTAWSFIADFETPPEGGTRRAYARTEWAGGYLRIEVDTEQVTDSGVALEVLDIRGRTVPILAPPDVLPGNLKATLIDQFLPPGTYFLCFTTSSPTAAFVTADVSRNSDVISPEDASISLGDILLSPSGQAGSVRVLEIAPGPQRTIAIGGLPGGVDAVVEGPLGDPTGLVAEGEGPPGAFLIGDTSLTGEHYLIELSNGTGNEQTLSGATVALTPTDQGTPAPVSQATALTFPAPCNAGDPQTATFTWQPGSGSAWYNVVIAEDPSPNPLSQWCELGANVALEQYGWSLTPSDLIGNQIIADQGLEFQTGVGGANLSPGGYDLRIFAEQDFTDPVDGTAYCRCTGQLPPQWYWDPSQSGRGFAWETQQGAGFLLTYHYNNAGENEWWLGLGGLDSPGFIQQLDGFVDGQSILGPFEPNRPDGIKGTAAISPTGPDTALFNWPGGPTMLEPFDFDGNGVIEPPFPGAPEGGWWWNPTEPGRGQYIGVQGTTLFLGFFAYATVSELFLTAPPRWYIMLTEFESPTRATGELQEFVNGPRLDGTPGTATFNQAFGPTSVEFLNGQTGIITLPNGMEVPIERFGFGFSDLP